MKYYAIELHDPYKRYTKIKPATKHNKRKLKEIIDLAQEGHLSLLNDITEFTWQHYDELNEDTGDNTYIVVDSNFEPASTHPDIKSAWEEAKYLEDSIDEDKDWGNEVLILELLTNKK